MVLIYVLAVVGFITIWFLPVIYLWCIKPGKSIQEGLKDWISESGDDL